MNNHYQTLKVSRDAPPEVIRMAYKVLCQKYHPDKYPENRAAAEQIMKALNAAYAVLSDPAKRKDYDDFLDEAEAINEELKHSGTGQQSQKPKAEPKQEARQNSYNYKAKAKSQPNDFKHGTDNSPRPWRRFFARSVDYFVAAFVVLFFIGYFRQLGLLSQKTSISLMNPVTFGFIAYFVWIFMESALLAWFGNTPGKMLFGLRVVSSQQPPRYLNRAFSVWFRGIGLGLPFVWLITASLAHSQLKKSGLTSWDKDYGFTVEAYPIGVIQRTVAAGIVLALFVASLRVGKEYRTSWTKPEPTHESELDDDWHFCSGVRRHCESCLNVDFDFGIGTIIHVPNKCAGDDWYITADSGSNARDFPPNFGRIPGHSAIDLAVKQFCNFTTALRPLFGPSQLATIVKGQRTRHRILEWICECFVKSRLVIRIRSRSN